MLTFQLLETTSRSGAYTKDINTKSNENLTDKVKIFRDNMDYTMWEITQKINTLHRQAQVAISVVIEWQGRCRSSRCH